MPELPEVHTILRSLRPRLRGRKIQKIEVLEPRLRSPVARDFARDLEGKRVVDLSRRGKYLLLDLDGDSIWVLHLGMSGKLVWVREGRTRAKHDHIVACLDDGSELRYHDPRRFGLSLLVRRADFRALPQLSVLGPEPFDEQFSGAYLYSITRRTRRRIRDLLIDQGIVAGLGNIYANEILFQAGIRPTVRACRLGREGAARLAETTRSILLDAIRWRGTSFSDYRDGRDRRGRFQHHLTVYDREGKPCPVCGHMIKRVAWGNRSAFYCPNCQK